jgi:hypothetical protein
VPALSSARASDNKRRRVARALRVLAFKGTVLVLDGAALGALATPRQALRVLVLDGAAVGALAA